MTLCAQDDGRVHQGEGVLDRDADGDGHEGCPSHCQLVYVIKLTLKLGNYGLIWVENPTSHKRLVSVVE